MITKELIKKIRKIEIKSTKLVDEIFTGEYHTKFKGKGMEFEDIREYYPGDDVRNIDWNVSARHNQTYVKQFCEERELNVFLLIDVSKSNTFGQKKDFIAELGATLSYSANKNNDKVGLILFTDKVEKVIPSKSGRKHTLSIIENILDYEPKSKGTNISAALKFLDQIEKKRSIVFLISDFMDDDYDLSVKRIGKKHDLVMIRVIDPLEDNIPKGAMYTFEDLETGETYELNNLKSGIKTSQLLSNNYYNMIQLFTNEDYIKPLRLFFQRKVRR